MRDETYWFVVVHTLDAEEREGEALVVLFNRTHFKTIAKIFIVLEAGNYVGLLVLRNVHAGKKAAGHLIIGIHRVAYLRNDEDEYEPECERKQQRAREVCEKKGKRGRKAKEEKEVEVGSGERIGELQQLEMRKDNVPDASDR